jgi:hypothetical protein
MANKDTLLEMIDKELSIIINQHEKREEKLVNELTNLKKKIVSLEKENKELFSQLEQKKQKSVEPVSYIDRLEKGITYDLIDHLCLSASIQDAQFLLHICEKFVRDENVEMLLYIFELLEHNHSVLEHDDSKIHLQFIHLIEEILHGESISDSPENDHLLSSTLTLISNLHDTILKVVIHHLLEEKHDGIFDRVLLLNEPSMITKYLRVLMVYGFMDLLKKALQHILDVEWGFIDSSLTRNDFIFLLWYSYLFDFDEDLIDLGSISLQWFDASVNELNLYFYLYDQDTLDKEIYSKKVTEFTKGTVLIKKEQELILKKVEKRVQNRFAKRQKAPVYYDPVYILQNNWEDYFIEKKSLRKTYVSLPLYKNKNDNLASAFVDKRVLIHKDHNQVFLTESEIKSIMKEYKLSPKSKNASSSYFAWPSTDVSGDKIEREDNKMSEKSALMLMGYKVSGNLTRANRWEILRKAVPELGLRRVAYTIAHNVKLRKGQKNGERKYSNAITEWENDLAKLKSNYYKQDFNWPNT